MIDIIWQTMPFLLEGLWMTIKISLITILIYYALLVTFRSFIEEYGWTPAWMWAPTALIGIFGAVSLHRHFDTT